MDHFDVCEKLDKIAHFPMKIILLSTVSSDIDLAEDIAEKYSHMVDLIKIQNEGQVEKQTNEILKELPTTITNCYNKRSEKLFEDYLLSEIYKDEQWVNLQFNTDGFESLIGGFSDSTDLPR